jgi:CubicO group peptidase (beta-lactamase class C family)
MTHLVETFMLERFKRRAGRSARKTDAKCPQDRREVAASPTRFRNACAKRTDARLLCAMRVALLSLLVVGCSSEPAWEWPVAPPAEQGMDAATLEGARTYAFQPGKNTQGVVVTRRGVLVAEWYEDGRDATSYAASWSMAKSFTSALVGIAIDEGKIPGVATRLVDYYPQWAGSPREEITIEHTLHMSTGLMWNEDYVIENASTSDAVYLVFTTDSPLQFVVDKPLEFPPNTMFEYSSGNTLLLSGVIAKATGKSTGEYAQAKLFSKLDIKGAEWWRAKTGETLTYCCLDMTSRDFARFGLLYMRHGMWEGEQVVPAAWIDASLTPAPTYKGYGYQWWLQGNTDPALPADLFMANGHDGQFIYIIPSLELVVVRNGHYDKYGGLPVADPQLFLRYPSDGLIEGGGTLPPDTWSHVDFLRPILASIQ